LAQVETPENASVKLSVQPRGAVLGGVGIAMIAAGLWRVDGVLAALGLAVWCLLGLCAVLARLNPAGLEVLAQIPAKVQAGSVFPMVISLLNRRTWLDAFSVRIEMNLAAKSRIGGRAAWIAAGAAADLDLHVSVPERVWADVHRVRLVSDFPFGFFEVEKSISEKHSLWVLPKPMFPRGTWFSGGAMDSPQAEGLAAGQSPGEPHGLRPWRTGDSPRRIVWPATLRSLARGAGMVVRESDPPGIRPLRAVLVFHSYGTDGGLIRPDRFEKALSLAAGTLRQLHAMGMPVRFIADFDDWTPRPANTPSQIAKCLEILTLAKRSGTSEAHDLQAALAGISDEEGLVILSDMALSSWKNAVPKSKRGAFTPEVPSTSKRREVAR
jgi:uncharacterized protein (DUF58 family)